MSPTHPYFLLPPSASLDQQQRVDPTKPIAPFLGIAQSVRFCDGGKLILAINNKVDFLFRQQRQQKHGDNAAPGEQVPVLDTNARTLAGIAVSGGLKHKITDQRVQAEIESALRKLTFIVEYTKGQGWIERECVEWINRSFSTGLEPHFVNLGTSHRNYKAQERKGERRKRHCWICAPMPHNAIEESDDVSKGRTKEEDPMELQRRDFRERRKDLRR
jgi:hypothetical protein